LNNGAPFQLDFLEGQANATWRSQSTVHYERTHDPFFEEGDYWVRVVRTAATTWSVYLSTSPDSQGGIFAALGGADCCGYSNISNVCEPDFFDPSKSSKTIWNVVLTLENNNCCKDSQGNCQPATPNPNCDGTGATGPCDEEPI
jgi:hypothetical protein